MITWQYALDALPYLVITGLLGLVIAHYRKILSGDLLPRATVDRIIAAKDAEIERLSMQLNLEAEANRQSVDSSQEQITAAVHLVTAMAHSVQEARRQLPEVVSGNAGAYGAHVGGNTGA